MAPETAEQEPEESIPPVPAPRPEGTIEGVSVNAAEIQVDDFLEDEKIEQIELGPRLRTMGELREGREEIERKVISNKQEKQLEREKKRKSKGWKVRAGGGYVHQLFNN